MQNIIIKNPKELEKTKEAIRQDGANKLHIISDFDKTLTYGFVDGEKRPSLISVLRDGNYLTPDYPGKARALFNKYHPIETNPDISPEDKKRAMEEWWRTHFDLLIKSKLNKKDLEKIVASRKIRFRDGVLEFIDFLHQYNIPLVILSSTGLGEETISLYLKNEGKLYNNIYIISNSFEWDAQGYATAVKEPIIHSLNKDESAIQALPVYQKIKNRKNVLLFGNSVDDLEMIKGFDYDNLIKVGFLDEEIEKNIEYYKNNYDIVILNNSSLDCVNDLLKEIISGRTLRNLVSNWKLSFFQ